MMRQTHRKAFTLLEILIATGIFMTVMVTAIGIFASTVSSSSTTGQLRTNAQAVRFAFESMTRESRLSNGLVYTDPSEPLATRRPLFILPPFEVRPAAFVIYRVVKTADTGTVEPAYEAECRIYRSVDDQLELQTFAGESPKTASQLRTIVQPQSGQLGQQWAQNGEVCQANGGVAAGTYWKFKSKNGVLARDVRLAKLDFSAYANYPFSPDDLKIQPFVQMKVTAESVRNASSADLRKIRTTLQTMIVPRDFATKYEVAQEGVQGVGQ